MALIIDIEGFMINGKFTMKEVAVMHTEKKKFWLFYAQLPEVNFKALTFKDQKTIKYVQNNIHGLKYENEPEDLAIEELKDRLKQIDKEVQPKTWLYKGGTYERDLLRELGFPGCNIETLGCHKFTRILVEENEIKHRIPRQLHTKCLRHELYKRSVAELHCSLIEIFIFREWLQKHHKGFNWIK